MYVGMNVWMTEWMDVRMDEWTDVHYVYMD